jgi:hypothetical protein
MPPWLRKAEKEEVTTREIWSRVIIRGEDGCEYSPAMDAEEVAQTLRITKHAAMEFLKKYGQKYSTRWIISPENFRRVIKTGALEAWLDDYRHRFGEVQRQYKGVEGMKITPDMFKRVRDRALLDVMFKSAIPQAHSQLEVKMLEAAYEQKRKELAQKEGKK